MAKKRLSLDEHRDILKLRIINSLTDCVEWDWYVEEHDGVRYTVPKIKDDSVYHVKKEDIYKMMQKIDAYFSKIAKDVEATHEKSEM